jgi:hypothetical protein
MSEFNPIMEELLSSAIDLPENERRSFLENACKDNRAQLEEILSLLDSASSSGLKSDGTATSGTSGVSASVQYDLDANSALTRFHGNAQASASGSGGGGGGKAVCWTGLWISVVDEAVNYEFSGSLANEFCFATIEKAKSGGGWETPSIYDIHGDGISSSGSLGTGIYRIKLGAVANTSGDVPSSSFDFQFKMAN